MTVTSFCIPYLSVDISLETVVFAVEKIHQMGKIDKIMCTKKGNHCSCYVYMEYWDKRKEISVIVDTIRRKERYRMYYKEDKFLVLFPNFRASRPIPPVHMDLIVAVHHTVKDSTVMAHFIDLHIGKIRRVTSEPIAKSENSHFSSRQVLYLSKSLAFRSAINLFCLILLSVSDNRRRRGVVRRNAVAELAARDIAKVRDCAIRLLVPVRSGDPHARRHSEEAVLLGRQ